MEHGGPSDQSTPLKEEYDGLETVEERLKSTIFVLREERANLKRKYNDVLGKNQKYREKDDESEQKKAELRAEVARLENRNVKILQELKDTVLEITRLKDRNAELEAESSDRGALRRRIGELENICENQSQQTIADEVHFDKYVEAVAHLTSDFRERSRHLPRSEQPLSHRMIKPEHGEHSDMVILEAARTESVNPLVPTHPRPTPLPSVQLRSIDARTCQSTLPQATESGNGGHRDTANPKFVGKWIDPTSRTGRSVHSAAGHLHGESRLLTPSNGHRVGPQDAGPSECSKKRALLPDVELSNGSEKRRRQERHHLAPQCKGTDPRLRRH